jgi:hypothetical protein
MVPIRSSSSPSRATIPAGLDFQPKLLRKAAGGFFAAYNEAIAVGGAVQKNRTCTNLPRISAVKFQMNRPMQTFGVYDWRMYLR